MKEILELIAKNYPVSEDNPMYPALLIYDDGSGCLVKDSTISAYKDGNTYFSFNNLEQLKEYLSNPPKEVYEDTLLGEVDEEFPY